MNSFVYFKDLGSVDDDPIEARFRRSEDAFQSKFDLLNNDNKALKEDNKMLKEKVDQLLPLKGKLNELMPLKDEVNQLKETVKKQEDVIRQWLLGKQRDDKDNKDYAVGIAEGGF